MNTYTYKFVENLKSNSLNVYLKEEFNKLPIEYKNKIKKKEYIDEKRKLLKKIILEDENIKKFAEIFYSYESGYGSDDEELLQDWKGPCNYRLEQPFGNICKCKKIHHALSGEIKCNCIIHYDRPSIYKWLNK